VFLAALFYRSGDSVLPTMAAHISLNVVLGVGGVDLASFAFWMTMVVLTAPVALISMVWSSARQRDITDKDSCLRVAVAQHRLAGHMFRRSRRSGEPPANSDLAPPT